MNNNENEEIDNVNKDLLDKLPEHVSMITKVWGPPAWFFLHSMAMSYPKKINENNPEHRRRKNAMFAFLTNLGDVLPCPLCGTSYNSYIRDPSLSVMEHLNTRSSLIEFIYKIHNKVNIKLGVPKCNKRSFKEVVKFYSQFIAGPCTATTDEERQQRLLLGCNNNDIEKGKWKDFKCNVNVFDNNSNKNINNFDNSEKFTGNFTEKFTENLDNNQNSTLTIIFGIFAFIFLITSIILLLKIKN